MHNYYLIVKNNQKNIKLLAMGISSSKGRKIKYKKLTDQPNKLTMEQDRVLITLRKKSLCQITTKKSDSIGFLCRIPNIENPVLITNNHVLGKTQICPGTEIDISFTDEK